MDASLHACPQQDRDCLRRTIMAKPTSELKETIKMGRAATQLVLHSRLTKRSSELRIMTSSSQSARCPPLRCAPGAHRGATLFLQRAANVSRSFTRRQAERQTEDFLLQCHQCHRSSMSLLRECQRGRSRRVPQFEQ